MWLSNVLATKAVLLAKKCLLAKDALKKMLHAIAANSCTQIAPRK
jgi:hypothetical protein